MERPRPVDDSPPVGRAESRANFAKRRARSASLTPGPSSSTSRTPRPAVGADGHDDRRPPGRELDRVRDDVLDDLLDRSRVSRDDDRRPVDPDADLLPRGRGDLGLDDLPRDAEEVARPLLEGDPSGLGRAHLDEARDEVADPLGGGDDLAAMSAVSFRENSSSRSISA